MTSTLKDDLDRHNTLAFQRVRPGAELIRRYHDLPGSYRENPHFKRAYDWLLVPLSLWPIDVIGLAEHLFTSSPAGLNPGIIRLLELLGDPPSLKTCNSISAHEQQVQHGNYESLIKAKHKFDFMEGSLTQNSEFTKDWQWIKQNFDVQVFQSKSGVIRRRMVSERNFRPPDWDFKWQRRDQKFWNIFDTFCHKWVLYGMQGDKPLLQKPSVNVTPYGTMIVIPRYWSLDSHRDLKWPAITRLHKSRGVSKQGIKLADNQKDRKKLAEKAKQLYAEAKAQGLKGEKRYDWIFAKLGFHPDTNPKQLWRLIKQG